MTIDEATDLNPTTEPEEGKAPAIACLLSSLLPGAGQIYAGRPARGLVILVAAIGLAKLYVGIGIWAWQIFDAATCARAPR